MAHNNKLTEKETKDLEQFTKFFAIKCIQVIVQARLGEKVNTRSGSTSSRSDWFNVSVIDEAGVQAEARKQLSKHLPEIGRPLCIEISLKTSEGDTMILETWTLAMTDKADPGVRIHYKVYNRMSLLLKSLICLARTTPAYRVSRHQSPDEYKIFYRIFFGEVKTSLLGEDHKTIHVGSVVTPVGSLMLSASYRTNLTLTQRSLQQSNSNPMKVSDDHYGSPKMTTECKPCSNINNRPGEATASHESGLGCVAYFSTSPPDKSTYEILPRSNTITGDQHHTTCDEFQRDGSDSLSGDHKLGAFAIMNLNQSPDLVDSQVDLPFVSLLTDSRHSESPKHKVTVADIKQESDTALASTLQKSSESQHSSVDDFVMVDLKLAFARSDPSNNFSSFYRDLQCAPDLEMFSNPPSVAETLGDVPNQLAKYEATASELDHFVDVLLQTKEDND